MEGRLGRFPCPGNANPCLDILLIHQCQRRFSPEGHRTTSKEHIFFFCPGCRTDCGKRQHFPKISQDGNLLAPLQVHLTFSCILNIQYFFGTKQEGFQQVCKTCLFALPTWILDTRKSFCLKWGKKQTPFCQYEEVCRGWLLNSFVWNP